MSCILTKSLYQFCIGFYEEPGHHPFMKKGAWGTPAILQILLRVQKQMQLSRAKEIDSQLHRAKALLDNQIQNLKKQKNG